MKTLILMRHAKSDRSVSGQEDYERPLAVRGMKAAPRMGQALRDRNLVPDVVLCSKARRACETWELVEPELGVSPRVVFQRGLYMAAPGTLLAAVQDLPQEAALALLVGHNPGLEYLAGVLAGPGSDPEAQRCLAAKFPSAALAVLTFETQSWSEVTVNLGCLGLFLCPRDLD